MTVSIVSAQPHMLVRYCNGAQYVNTHLHNEAARLAHALARFNAGCTEYPIGVDGSLADALRGHVARVGPTDQWVGQVARQFLSADRALPLGALGMAGPQLAERMQSEAREIMLQAARDVTREQIHAAADWLIRRPARTALAFAGNATRTQGQNGRQAFDFAIDAPKQLASAALSGARQAAIGAWQGLTGLARGVWHFVKGAAERVAQFVGWLGRAFANSLRIMGGGLEMLVGFARALQPGIVAAARAYLTHAVGFARGMWEGAWDFVSGTATIVLDAGKLLIGDQAAWAKYGQIVEAFRTNPLGTLKTMGKAIVAPIVDDWRHGRYGEAVGRATFEVLPTILAAFTGGGSEAAYLSKLSKLGGIAEAAQVSRGAVALGTAARFGENVGAVVSRAAGWLKETRLAAAASQLHLGGAQRLLKSINTGAEAALTIARGRLDAVAQKIGRALGSLREAAQGGQSRLIERLAPRHGWMRPLRQSPEWAVERARAFGHMTREQALHNVRREFRELGVQVHSGVLADKLLDFVGWVFDKPGEEWGAFAWGKHHVFVRREHIDNPRVLREEQIHILQHRSGRRYASIDHIEHEARELMIEHQHAWGISDGEAAAMRAETHALERGVAYLPA
jgi:hypothetical protein